MPCRGPCGQRDEKTGAECLLDCGHEGPCDWTQAYKVGRARELRDAALERDGKRYGAMHISMDQLLCSACRALERLGYDIDENPALAQWWEAHKARDRRLAK